MALIATEPVCCAATQSRNHCAAAYFTTREHGAYHDLATEDALVYLPDAR